MAANTQITLTVAGTASGSGTDYTATFPTTVTISSGGTTADTAAFNIATVDDTVSEGTETIIVSGSATGFNVNSATVNLLDNDLPTITLTVVDSSGNAVTSLTEADTASKQIRVKATLDGGARTTSTAITLSTGGTATAGTGNDYIASFPSSITIPANSASAQTSLFNIRTLDDTDNEGDETITVSGSATGFTVNSATVTLQDNDLPVITLSVVEDSVGNPAVTSISEASTAAKSIKIRATAATAVAANTQITLSVAGTASGSGTDYTATFPTTVTISSGGTTADTAAFNIATVDDSVSEGTETIIVSGSATGFNVSSATVNLNDNDQPLITLSLSVSSATEAAGNQAVTVSATRSASSTAQLSVTVTRQSSSTAVHGTDYTGSTSATISFAAGNTSSTTATFNINPRQDVLVEGDETIVLGATVTGHTVNTATFTITDDDSASTGFSLSVNPTSLDESADSTAVTVTATVNGGAVVGNTVVGLSLGGTATGGGTDYTMTGTLPSITISAGTRSGSATINFDPVDDSLDESDGTASRPHETIIITGTKTSGDTSITTGGSATVTITDNDATPNTINLSFEPASVDEDASGNVAVKVVATLVGDSTRTVDDDGAAGLAHRRRQRARLRLVGLPTSVTIAAGQSKGEATGLMINPTDNSISDGDRTITLAQHATNTLPGFAVNDGHNDHCRR